MTLKGIIADSRKGTNKVDAMWIIKYALRMILPFAFLAFIFLAAVAGYPFVKYQRAKHIDHESAQALLRFARATMAQSNLDGKVDPFESISLPPTALPDSLQWLETSWIMYNSERMHIELGSGFWHFGFDCFAANADQEGDRKIIDGVWFSED